MIRRAQHAALFAAMIVILSSVGWSQEELPAPAGTPQPAPRQAAPRKPAAQPAPAAPVAPPADFRALRRERLRNLGSQVLGAVLPPDGSIPVPPGLAPPPGAQPQLDLPRLNAALNPIVSALLGGGDNVESLRVSFDPQGTNFAADKARLRLDASLRRTAWAEGPTVVNAVVGVQIAPDDTGRLAALLDGRMRLQTPTVALVNYAIAQYKSREKSESASAGVRNPPPLYDEIFSQMLDEKLARVERLESMDDVADLLTAISGLRLTALSQAIEQLRSESKAATDAATRQAIDAELAEVRSKRDRLFDVRPRITRDKQGQVQMIALDMIGSELFPGADMRQMNVEMTAREVNVQAAGSLTQWVELYPLMKPVMMSVLTRIQSGDPRALDAVRPFLDGLLGRGRTMVFGPREF